MIKAIVVDDEAPARSELRFMLDSVGDVEVVGEAATVRDALEKFKDHGADVMFLDINMPGVVGLQLAEGISRLKTPPAVVFVTAYSEFAAQAFDVNAVDYLVKPVETDRLLQALHKVKQYLSGQARVQQIKRIPVEKSGRHLMILTNHIRYIMARDDYSYVHTDSDRYLSTLSLAQFESNLEGFGFFRVHRRYLVNLSFVEELLPQPGGGLLLKLVSEPENIPVSRRRVAMLKKAMDL
ncbi:MAG: LytTR family DNA-binding domain-containing protein [Actinomycetia bacterium]|nr:LytTR family DNA-binding domain-containing protein [Actinomycetes bacterium]